MHDSPAIDDLLAAARASVLHELLPVLPDAAHYEALMVANALAIVRRMLNSAEAVDLAEIDALQGIYSEDLPADSGPEGAAITLQRRLAADIRHGFFDAPGPRRSAVQDLLIDRALRHVRVSNPKAEVDATANMSSRQPGTRQAR